MNENGSGVPHAPARLGVMLLTMADPVPGHEVAYNRWYERDHFYAACMAGPGVMAGRRWVATRRLKDLRFPDPSPVLDDTGGGSFLSLYWTIAGGEDGWLDHLGRIVPRLEEEGRGFSHRTLGPTGTWSHVSSIHADADGVPAQLALDHDFGGVIVLFVDVADGVTTAEFGRSVSGAARGLFDGGVDHLSIWASTPSLAGPAGGDTVVLAFTEDDPARHWDSVRGHAAELAETGAGTVTFAAPFVPTIVGTDAYCDELW